MAPAQPITPGSPGPRPARRFAVHGILLAMILILGVVGCLNWRHGEPAAPSAETIPVKLVGQEFHLELALTPEARYHGLSDRTEVPRRGGMLFVFPDDDVVVQGFCMRRCLVPLDILFLAPDGTIVKTHEMQMVPYDLPEMQLPSYSSEQPAQYAIELRAGTLRELGLRPGPKVALPIADLKRRTQ